MEGAGNSETAFKEQLIEIHRAKKCLLLTKDEYFTLVEELKQASQRTSKSRKDYYILSR